MHTQNLPILIIDDFPMIRSILANMLKDLGYSQVAEAEDGQTAWSMITKAHAAGRPYGAILVDWNMPRMSGIELIERCRSMDEYRNLPLIVVTAEREKESVLRALKAGATDYITKPITPEILGRKLEAALTKASHFSKAS